jgi:hypothetical protein
MDEGLESSAPVHSAFAGRLKSVDGFVMTCGVAVPLDVDTLTEAIRNMRNWSARSRAAVADDPRFAIGIYRAALRSGISEKIQFRYPGELQFESEDAD